MIEKKSKQFRAYFEDFERIEAFMKRHGLKSTADFMTFVADNLDKLETDTAADSTFQQNY